MTVTDPQAVVAFTDGDAFLKSLDAASMVPLGVGHYDAQDLEEATAVIEQYAPTSEHQPLASLDNAPFLTVEQLAADLNVLRPSWALDYCTLKVQEQLQDTVRRRDSAIGRAVTFSLDEPEVLDPQVCYGALTRGMRLFRPGVCEAIAVAYYPRTVRMPNAERGDFTSFASWFDTDGYCSIVRIFPTASAANAASKELQQAVRVFQKARIIERYSDDPVRLAHIEAEITRRNEGPQVSVL